MATPFKISARIELDGVSTAVTNAGLVQKAVAGIGPAAEQSATKLQQLINASVGLHSGAVNDNARRWSGLFADEAMSIDRLRAKYNPLFAVINQYKQAQVEIRTAHAMGALSADEMTAALSRQRQATLQSIDAIKGRNRAIAETPAEQVGASANQRFQSANLAFQVQDVITTAPFMPWYTVALQQGPQVAAVLDTLENKSAGLATAFMSLISPWSLLSVAAVGASAFAIQYFSSVESEADRADAALEGHAEIIRRIKEAYGDAAEGLREYADESDKLLQQDIVDRIKSYREAILDTAKSVESSILSIPAEAFGGATYTISELQGALNQLSAGIKSGHPDLRAFVERLVDIENQKGTPEEIRKLIKELRDGAAAGVTAQRALQPLVGTINGIGAAAAAQAERVSVLSKALRDLNGLSLPSLSPLEEAAKLRDEALESTAGATEAGVRQIMDAYDRAITRIQNNDPTVVNSDGNQVRVPTPDDKPIQLGEALSRANGSAANAYRDLIKSADDRIEQMKLEAEMAGKVGVEADALRFSLDLLQQAEDKGRTISEKQREEIGKKVEAFKEYAEAAATAKLRADLLWESEQSGRTWMEQQIAGRLRSAGKEIDFESYEADLIRMNLALEVSKSYAAEFSDTLFDGLAKGEDLFDTLADAGIAAFKRLGKSLWDDVLNSLFSIGGGGGSGGGLFSGIFSGIFGGGFKSNTTLGDYLTTGFGGAASAATSALGAASNGARMGVAPLLPANRSVDQVASASASAISRLKIELGLASDGALNLRPEVVGVVQETAPDMIVDIVEQNNEGEAARVADHNQHKRWR